MVHPSITWHCGNCGYSRGEQHTCPPDQGETIGSLVDALPRNTPSSAVLEEIEALSRLRKYRLDAVTISKDALAWLLGDRSFVELATEKLRPYTAEVMNAAAPVAAPPAPPAPRRCLWCGGEGGGHCAECEQADTERGQG